MDPRVGSLWKPALRAMGRDCDGTHHVTFGLFEIGTGWVIPSSEGAADSVMNVEPAEWNDAQLLLVLGGQILDVSAVVRPEDLLDVLGVLQDQVIEHVGGPWPWLEGTSRGAGALTLSWSPDDEQVWWANEGGAGICHLGRLADVLE